MLTHSRIATRTLRLIDSVKREHWMNTNLNARNLIPKLLEKSQRNGISPAIQHEALYFYASIGGPRKLSQTVMSSYEAALMHITVWGETRSRSSLSGSLPLFAVRYTIQDQAGQVDEAEARYITLYNHLHLCFEHVMQVSQMAQPLRLSFYHFHFHLDSYQKSGG